MEIARHPWLVVGADGAIGGELIRTLRNHSIPAHGTTRRVTDEPWMLRLDLNAEPTRWLLPERTDVVFLCAAVTSIDRCQQHPAETRLVNVERTLQLANSLHERGAHLVFLSTNQVFDGSHAHQLPDAPVCPRTEYGRQKAEVERELQALGNVTVVRLTKVAPPKMKLLQAWTETLRRGEAIAAFNDMVMSPIPLAFAVMVLERIGERKPRGIMQVSGECDVTYAEVARRLAERLNVASKLVQSVPIRTAGLSRDAAPLNTTLDSTRLIELGLEVPPVWTTINTLVEGVIRE